VECATSAYRVIFPAVVCGAQPFVEPGYCSNWQCMRCNSWFGLVGRMRMPWDGLGFAAGMLSEVDSGFGVVEGRCHVLFVLKYKWERIRE
jgi:hypothetical protein